MFVLNPALLNSKIEWFSQITTKILIICGNPATYNEFTTLIARGEAEIIM